jgi:hypothetical protein
MRKKISPTIATGRAIPPYLFRESLSNGQSIQDPTSINMVRQMTPSTEVSYQTKNSYGGHTRIPAQKFINSLNTTLDNEKIQGYRKEPSMQRRSQFGAAKVSNNNQYEGRNLATNGNTQLETNVYEDPIGEVKPIFPVMTDTRRFLLDDEDLETYGRVMPPESENYVDPVLQNHQGQQMQRQHANVLKYVRK